MVYDLVDSLHVVGILAGFLAAVLESVHGRGFCSILSFASLQWHRDVGLTVTRSMKTVFSNLFCRIPCKVSLTPTTLYGSRFLGDTSLYPSYAELLLLRRRVEACTDRCSHQPERWMRSGPVGHSLSCIVFAPVAGFCRLFGRDM